MMSSLRNLGKSTAAKKIFSISGMLGQSMPLILLESDLLRSTVGSKLSPLSRIPKIPPRFGTMLN